MKRLLTDRSEVAKIFTIALAAIKYLRSILLNLTRILECKQTLFFDESVFLIYNET